MKPILFTVLLCILFYPVFPDGSFGENPCSNVRVYRVTGEKIVVYYDLSGLNLYTVMMEASLDGGKSFPVTARSATGDVGSGISPGAFKRIEWNLTRDGLPQSAEPQLRVVAVNDSRELRTHDDYGEKIIVAHRTDQPVHIDGVLSETAWRGVVPTSDFIQREPVDGVPPAQKTEVRILYDHDNLYIGIMCYDPEPGKIVRHELIRDGEIVFDDHFMVQIDTYDSKRTAWQFRVNANGAIADAVVTGYKTTNSDWDGVWDAAAKITGSGWSAEIVIPFKTLRFPNTDTRIWGINFSRVRPREAFTQYIWTSWRLNDGMTQLSKEGKLVGLEDIESGKQLDFKPYVLMSRGKLENTTEDNEFKYGLDVTYGIASNLTLDITTHTDFAQIEADKEQINLTRFSLFYPEKRDFFLEGGEIFNFGQDENQSQIFYSRRIGLTPDRELVPILAGGKITGKIGSYELGIINMQTKREGEFPSTNYAVVRVKKDILKKSYLGFMATSLYDRNDNKNRAYGTDFVYRSDSFLHTKNIEIGGWFAGTVSPGVTGDNLAGKVWINYPNDLMNSQTHFRFVDDNFNPEIGYVRRYGIKKYFHSLSFTPRTSRPMFKKIIITPVCLDYLTDMEGKLLERQNKCTLFGIENTDYDTVEIKLDEHYEYIDKDFTIFKNIMVTEGTYRWWNYEVDLKTPTSRLVSFGTMVEWGEFYDGRRTLVQSECLFNLHRNFQLAADGVFNRVSFDERGQFHAREYGTKIRINLSTALTTSTYLQWNNEQNRIHCNFRLRYIPGPGSDLYIVYNGLWDELHDYDILENRATFKLDYLFRF